MELTFRAALTGVLLGALLAAGNVYMGLRTGFWETGVVTATVIATALLPLLGRRFDPVEITLVQSIATSTGAVPAAAGLLGAVPGMALLGEALPWWWVVTFGLGAGGLGLVLALGLRSRLLDDEALPFPSGVAAAEVLRTRAGSGAKALGITCALSAGLTAFREGGLLPSAFVLPGRAGALGVGLASSPMLLGAGALIGLGNAVAVALGAATAWLWLGPALVRWEMVPDGSFSSVIGWLLWPGVGLMLGGAIASLARDIGAFRASAADLRITAAGILRSRRLGALGLVGVVLLLVSTRAGFGLGIAAGALAILAAVPAAIACARVAGRTDVSPSGELGQAVQGAAGALGLDPAGCTGAGAISAGVASQAAVGLWSLRAGSLVGTPPRAHARALLLGLATGAVVAVPLYELFLHAYVLGSSELPAPTAVRWRALAELVGGTSSLPPGATWALPAAIAVGIVLEVLRRASGGRLVPSPGVVGLGFLVPAHFAVAMLAGAGLAALAAHLGGGARTEPIAAGAIAGESMTALAAGVLVALGLLD